MIEPIKNYVQLNIKYDDLNPHTTFPAGGLAVLFTEQGMTVVRHRFTPTVRGWRSILNVVPSCVTAIKSFTGYSSAALTPTQLYKSLMRNGAELITSQED